MRRPIASRWFHTGARVASRRCVRSNRHIGAKLPPRPLPHHPACRVRTGRFDGLRSRGDPGHPSSSFRSRACACEIGRRRPNLADSTIKAHARTLERELDRLLELEPTNTEGRHLRDAIIVDARDKLLVFMGRRDVEPTNNGSERKLRPSVIFRRVTNSLRLEWGAKFYADLCSIVSTTVDG
jgi:hypothetical protein